MSDTEYITVARVSRTQGRKGEVFVRLHTDFPEKFAERKRLWAWMPDGTHRELMLEDHWPHKGQLVLKFVGIDSISDAEALVGCELQIPRLERVPLEAGAVYISDLVGCIVIDRSREVGAVTGLDTSSGAAPNLVVRSGQKEFLIPFAEQYLRRVDLADKRIEMELPQGLLELDVPLSPEEKQRQRG